MNYIVLDTETANSIYYPLCYNIGWIVVNEYGEVLCKRSYLVTEIFGDVALMDTAYYKKKIPIYLDALENDEIKETSIIYVRRQFRNDVKKFDISIVSAHNAPFDKRATKNTVTELTKHQFFIDLELTIVDTLKLARKKYYKDLEYTNFCTTFNCLTKKGRNSLTAESLYRYISKNYNFKEEHRALEDCLIEKEILLNCLDILSEL